MPGSAANGRQLGRHVLTPVDREDEACELSKGDQYCHRDESGEAKATTDAGDEYADPNDLACENDRP